MALARRRCYSIERLLRGVQISLFPFLNVSLSIARRSSLHPFPASQAPFPPGPPPPPSLSSSLLDILILHLFLLPPLQLASSLARTHARTHTIYTEYRYLSFWRSRSRPSVSVLPSDGFS